MLTRCFYTQVFEGSVTIKARAPTVRKRVMGAGTLELLCCVLSLHILEVELSGWEFLITLVGDKQGKRLGNQGWKEGREEKLRHSRVHAFCRAALEVTKD